MEYERKLQGTPMQVEPHQDFKACILCLRSKKFQPILYSIVMLLLVGMMWYNFILNNMSASFALFGTFLFGGIGLLQLLFIRDKIEVYEYGFVQATLFRKSSIAYDDIEYIEEKRMRKKQMFPSMWILYFKNDKKQMVFDASSYRNLESWIKRLEEETKIVVQR